MKKVVNPFSARSLSYAKYRPGYPRELFRFLAKTAPGKKLAWDCATGTGQAAVDLARDFACVIATDSSRRQISRAARHPRVKYRVAKAQRSGLKSGTVDLVTLAQGLHWVDQRRFFPEALRVLRPNGVLAAWYLVSLRSPRSPGVTRAIRRVISGKLGRFWPKAVKNIDIKHVPVHLLLNPIRAPRFKMVVRKDLYWLLGFLRTCSASRIGEEEGALDWSEIEAELRRAWGVPHRTRQLAWDIRIVVGRKP